VLANVFSLFLGPPVECPQAVALTRHCLNLLKGDVLLLRQLGGAGVWLQMTAIVEHGKQNLGVVQEVEKVRRAPSRRRGRRNIVGWLSQEPLLAPW
jgi:hypothetical protein